MYSCQFHAKSQVARTSSPYLEIHSSHFISIPLHPSRTTDDGSMLTLTHKDHNIFKMLKTCRSNIKKAVTALNGEKNKGVEDDEMDMDNEANADGWILEILFYIYPTDVWELAMQRKFLNTTY
jgi:hypothetical protein